MSSGECRRGSSSPCAIGVITRKALQKVFDAFFLHPRFPRASWRSRHPPLRRRIIRVALTYVLRACEIVAQSGHGLSLCQPTQGPNIRGLAPKSAGPGLPDDRVTGVLRVTEQAAARGTSGLGSQQGLATPLPMNVVRPWRVIVNPASGRPDGGAGWRAIERALREVGCPSIAVHTQHPGPRRGPRPTGAARRPPPPPRRRRRRLRQRDRPGRDDRGPRRHARGDARRRTHRHRQRLGPLARHRPRSARDRRRARRRADPAARRRCDRLSRPAARRAAGSSTSRAPATTPTSRRGCRDPCRRPSPTCASRSRASRATARRSSASPPTAEHDRGPAAARLRRQRPLLRQPHARGAHRADGRRPVRPAGRAASCRCCRCCRSSRSSMAAASSATRRCATCRSRRVRIETDPPRRRPGRRPDASGGRRRSSACDGGR